MQKVRELTDPGSCINRAHPEEMTFVLLGRDPIAADAIQFWALLRVETGKNDRQDAQIIEAMECAKSMRAYSGPARPDLLMVCPVCGEPEGNPHSCLAVLKDRVRKLSDAVVNQRGDDLCWITEPTEAKALPESEFLLSCARFRRQIAIDHGEVDAASTMTIAQLEAKIESERRQFIQALNAAGDMALKVVQENIELRRQIQASKK